MSTNSLPRTSLTTRSTCRVCDSPHLTPVLSLGEQCIAGAFADPKGGEPVQRPIPLELVRCDMTKDQNACGLIQTRHTVPGSILYANYWYRSGINKTMTDNLHGIAQTAESLVRLKPDDLVVDIGCNDGTLLDGYKTRGLKSIGFDPSDVTRYAVEKGYDVVKDFFNYEAFERRYPGTKARVITSIAMFYDLEYPSVFVGDIAKALADDGVWVLELHYLPMMMEMNAFDAIVHEHLEYYSLAVIERLLAEAGLESIRAELNDSNGGSIRLFVGKAGGREVTPGNEHLVEADRAGLKEIRIKEFEMALDAPEPYERFRLASEKVRDDLLALCKKLKKEGKTIHVYGASTKGNTILQYAGIDSTIVPYAADRNPDKWGSETIATKIPIISEDESRAMKPDYYLALPWHFLDEFLSRETEFLERGGKFIVPMPEVHIAPGN